MELKKQQWGTIKGKTIHLYRVIDETSRFQVSFTEIGASIVRVRMPDKDGNIADIHYGRGNPKAVYENEDDGYLGSIVGRVASFLYFAQFELDGEQYDVSTNMFAVHSTHGGKHGFNEKIWKVESTDVQDDRASIKFSYLSKNGEEGYPGNLQTRVTYTVTSDMELTWEITATTDKATIVNIINHAYWNLEGFGRLIDEMEFQINGTHQFQVKMGKVVVESLLHLLHLKRKHERPPYEIKPLDRLELDLTESHSFSHIFDVLGDLDGTILLKKSEGDGAEDQELKYAAKLYSKRTGRKMAIYTTEPAAIVYTGNYMDKVESFGEKCVKHQAVCIETCRPENAVQFNDYKNMVILRPGDTYRHKTSHKFSIID